MHAAEPPAFSHPAYTYDRNNVGAAYPATPPARRFSRVLLMCMIFVIGALAGVSTAWFLKRPAGVSPSAVSSAPEPKQTATAPSGMRRGISASELPYDGKPPPPEEEDAAASLAADLPPATPAISSGTSGTASAAATGGDVAAAPEAPPSARTGTTLAEDKPVRRVQEKPEEARPVTKTAKAYQAPRQEKDKEIDRLRQQADEDRSGSRQAAKDREIERIRQQAADELKKKIEKQRIADEARSRTGGKPSSRPEATKRQTVSAQLNRRAMLAQCERRSNFILRESCKWDLCDGSWGKNGCPSYEKQAGSY